ncbi:hypothetical protein FACS189421_09700 [Bacteroidia bacterium]|nr:hypothetical protein FACS189421_09700 [Bacteroidia bacterium]GHT87807.1 hypothetical protein FACS189474_1580 [Bacteroidia bacterium]
MVSNEKTLDFIVFCIEEYKNAKKLKGEEVYRIFDETGVIDFLNENFSLLHTFGKEYVIDTIDEFIKNESEKRGFLF